MKQQLELVFDAQLEYRLEWHFKGHGITEARDRTIELLNEALDGKRQWPVTFFDIVRRELGLPDDSAIPTEVVDRCSAGVAVLRDQRLLLLAHLAQLGYDLVCVNKFGESSLGGGLPTVGFNLRNSHAGVNQDLHGLKMASSAVRKYAVRLTQAGIIHSQINQREISDELIQAETDYDLTEAESASIRLPEDFQKGQNR